MREDMCKVIVERPRLRYGRHAGSRYQRAKVKHMRSRDLEGAPRCQSMKFAVHRKKWFNENLSPLRRFLEGQIGRPWDKVYSEICAGIDRKSAVQEHIAQHIDDFVVRDVELVEGRPFRRRYGVLEPIELGTRNRGRFGLYVCPRTRLLRRAPERRRS
jgi:hypothetical protein